MTARLQDPRSQGDVTHDLASLIRTSLLLVGMHPVKAAPISVSCHRG
jgi:hypothetical protein